jgi:two-component system chemotaxis sensor kinase CheA
MSIDLSQFHEVFYEESYEGLDAMEQGLLEMDIESPDDEVINTIFRAAHSIKGGSGTFGFNQVAEFTHVVETLLDEVRSGDRAMDQVIMDLLLVSVDCMRSMLQELQSGEDPDLSDAKELKAQFEAILNGESAPQAGTINDSAASDGSGGGDDNGELAAENDTSGQGYLIHFVPEETMLQTGNEPTRMFRQLAEICDNCIEVTASFGRMPALTLLNPEHCYLSWDIKITKAVDRAEVDEIFEWVIDDAEITITELWAEDVADNESTAAEVENGQPQDSAPEAAVEPAPAAEPIASSEAAEQPDKAKAPAKAKAAAPESSSIRVSIDKVDSLINMVGELVITQSMLGQLGENFDISRVQRLQEGLAQLEHNTRELQESVMKIRMMPISFVFSRFPRLVRDVSRSLNKKIDLVLSGETTELDKTVMEKIGDPMVHLIRNSIDHGIETPDIRIAAGKPETGTVQLNAFHQSGNIVIEIKDDGAGLNKERIHQKAVENGLIEPSTILQDEQIFDLIFQPGFSTAEAVSDLSGRGVGMDVVRRNIASLNGSIEVSSETGLGSRFVIRLPLTLAILDGQLVRVGDEVFIFPLVSIVESIQMDDKAINHVGGHSDVLQLREEYVPIVQLHEIFSVNKVVKPDDDNIIVVVETDGEKLGVVVDELLGQQQVVIKSLEDNFKKVEGISGATILGDGTVALIVDVSGVSKMSGTTTKLIDSAHKAA